jgi:hypothetical protein
MARHARVNSRHHLVPLIANLVQVRVANAAEKYLNLDVGLGWIAPRDRGGS